MACHINILTVALANYYQSLMQFDVALLAIMLIAVRLALLIVFRYRCVLKYVTQAKIFGGIADIGYNATKKMPFYSFKVHMLVSADGVVLNYEVTPASVSDVTAAPELLAQCSEPVVLADVGYVGKLLQRVTARDGIRFWTPDRSNMKGAKQHNDRKLKALRRTIESRFAVLTQQYGVENNLGRSLAGCQL